MGSEANEQELLDLLSGGATYAIAGAPVMHRETHGAHVFLTGAFAWKIKRHVKFSYMDFSTPEKRQRALERELEFNRRTAPEIYVGLVPITRSAAGMLHLDGEGEPIEWVLKMRRFDERDLLSARIALGVLEPDLTKSLADVVAASHRDAPQVRVPNASSRVERVLAGLTASLRGTSSVMPRQTVDAFNRSASGALDRARGIIDRRGAEGYVRHCHGDLHLANVVVWQGRPVLYDALEFDVDLATVDTLYDLAFLLMDLQRARHRECANMVLNRYLWRTNDPLDLEGLAALPLFMALRAGVRALVATQHGIQLGSEPDATEMRAEFVEARGYLDLALEMLELRSARMIAIGGLSGTGKSTLAAALAPAIGNAPGALHLRSDLERKAVAGVEETTRLDASHYTPEVSADVYRRLLAKARLAIAAGHSVIVDAVFAAPGEREAIGIVAAEMGAAFQGLWLEAPAKTLLDRVAARQGDASDADASVLVNQLTRKTSPLTWARLDASGTIETVVERARAALASPS